MPTPEFLIPENAAQAFALQDARCGNLILQKAFDPTRLADKYSKCKPALPGELL